MEENKRKVLIVDDDVTSLRVLQSVLKGIYDTAPARSGEQALNYLRRFTPDIILLDIDMPVMNGYEVLGRLKADSRLKDIPVIFLTGREGVESEVRGLSLGAVDYMQKPINEELVLARLNTHLELEMYRKKLSDLVDRKTRDLAQKNAILEHIQEIIIVMMAHATEYRDQLTGGHIRRTREYVALIIDYIFDHVSDIDPNYKIAPEYAANIISASQLHDIGKVAIPDAVLLKPGKLDDEEWKIMKTHPQHGADILTGAATELGSQSLLDVAREISLAHHEKWDGSGYPSGLKGEAIPISARITSISDVYDALRDKRPYKAGFDHEAARKIILEGRGTHFDPLLTDVFDQIHPEFGRLYDTIKK
ncbi:MAG: response regulator [Synergistaceae bacterium]|jgi:putative two-component system response regulator|nr:response regulator [Synergistaceae bacterium]